MDKQKKYLERLKSKIVKPWKSATSEAIKRYKQKKKDEEFFKKLTPKQLKESEYDYFDYLAKEKPKPVV